MKGSDSGESGSYVAPQMTAAEAAAFLGVSKATLYAYVSRGLLRSVPGKDRSRLYARSEVEALKMRAQPPRQAVRDALYWGLPSLRSEVSSIHGGELRYRGALATELAASCSAVQVAARLWSCDPATLDAQAPAERIASPFLESALHWLSFGLEHDPGGWDRTASGMARTGWRAFSVWRASLPAHPLLETALILCADHELNPSTFAARVAASTGANLYAVLLAALATLSGPRHGGACAAAEALVAEAHALGSARAAMLQRLRRGDAIPGFGHRLYPDGDPRARALLNQIPGAEEWVTAGADLLSTYPAVDLALVLLGLPPGAAFQIFATGRCLGWVAHAMEQAQDGRPIRPRAES